MAFIEESSLLSCLIPLPSPANIDSRMPWLFSGWEGGGSTPRPRVRLRVRPSDRPTLDSSRCWKRRKWKVDGRTDGRGRRRRRRRRRRRCETWQKEGRKEGSCIVGSSWKISKLKLFASSKGLQGADAADGKNFLSTIHPSFSFVRSPARSLARSRSFVLSILRHRGLEGRAWAH